jgi:hypothetical protein
LPSNALYPTYRASASNAVVTSGILNEESKCSVFKRVEGVGAPQDQTMVSIERNDEGRSKEGKGDTAELNTSLPLGVSKR